MFKLPKIRTLIRQDYRIELSDYCGEKNLNLGCGRRPLDDFVNVDYWCDECCDVKHDLNDPLPFEDQQFDLVFSDNVFEHISNLTQLVRECHRVLKPGGHLIVIVPYYRSRGAFVDPTHCHFFSVASFDYYVQGTEFYDRYRFFDEAFSSCKIILDANRRRRFLGNCARNLAVFWKHRYENGLLQNFITFNTASFILKK